MKTLRIIVTIIITTLLQGCGSQRVAMESISKDSVRVETHYVEVIKRDTIFIEIPYQSAHRETRDTISHLETKYALSDAKIDSDGILHHTLESKNVPIPVPTDTKTIIKDTTIYVDRNIYLKDVEYVERDLTDWQKWQMRSFWILLSVLLATLVYRFRKPIWTFVKTFITFI